MRPRPGAGGRVPCRYVAELGARTAAGPLLVDAGCRGDVTLLDRARATEHNSAVAQQEYLARVRATGV